MGDFCLNVVLMLGRRRRRRANIKKHWVNVSWSKLLAMIALQTKVKKLNSQKKALNMYIQPASFL